MDLVLCSIVTYNPNIANIIKIIEVCKNNNLKICIFDNGSENFNKLSKVVEKYTGVYLITKRKNIGIASALNYIFSFGENKKYVWIITLDQDSKVENLNFKKFISYLKIIDSKTAIICPKIIDDNTNEVIFGDCKELEQLKDAQDLITSGSCIKITAWKNVHGFYDKLFIDFVDTDFQEKLLLNNYKIFRCNQIVLHHKIGNAKNFKLGSIVIRCSNHSSFRRYYMVRNRLYYYRKYYGYYSYIKALIRLIFGTLKICFFEEEKIKKVKAFFKGWRDYKELL